MAWRGLPIGSRAGNMLAPLMRLVPASAFLLIVGLDGPFYGARVEPYNATCFTAYGLAKEAPHIISRFDVLYIEGRLSLLLLD
eukprot:8631136-Pyramimonas_sp.AAC.2